MPAREDVMFTNKKVLTRNEGKKGSGIYRQDTNGQWWYIHGSGRKRAKVCKCVQCGEMFPGQRYEKTCSKKCTYSLISEKKKGSGHHLWKGGRIICGGYIYLHRPDHPHSSKTGYVAEHRLIMEKVIGRYLFSNETVHHKNGLKADNCRSNLELWTGVHGPGQRVKDLVKFAIDILKLYKPDVFREKM